MTESPVPPPPDDKDWTWVLSTACPDCGFDAAALDVTRIGIPVGQAVDTLLASLAAPSAGQRPRPQVWSALEYACHVRDVCTLFAERARLIRTESDPLFANWDQDETALQERYWEQEPTAVAAELAAAAAQVVAEFGSATAGDWDRPGRRSNGSVFTLDSLARYFLHDVVHHAHDVSRRPEQLSRR